VVAGIHPQIPQIFAGAGDNLRESVKSADEVWGGRSFAPSEVK
jgi:hypothetical protein